MSNPLQKNFSNSERVIPTPEQPMAPERPAGKGPETKPSVAEVATAPISSPAVQIPTNEIPAVAVTTSTEQRLRQILSEDMNELLAPLSPSKKLEVQQEGLKTVDKLQTLLERTHLRFREVLKLIWHWLKRISGASRFFLEQEAKKKTEEVLELKENLENNKSL